MFPDEHRPEEELRQQYMDYRLSDPKELFIKYEGLVGRNRKLEKEISKLTGSSGSGTSGASSAEKAAWDEERQDLLRKLGEAHGALKIYREGYWQLRDDISELRNSRSMRLGRAITSPYQRLKSLGNRTDKQIDAPTASEGESASSKPKSSAASDAQQESSNDEVFQRPAEPAKKLTTTVFDSPKAIEQEQPDKQSSIGVDSSLPVGERSFERLNLEFAQDPVSIRLKRVLTRAWYAYGMITEPADLILKNPQLVAALPKKDQQLTEQILAAKRVNEELPPLAPRSRGAAYVTEPGRRMYCVHSTPVYNSNGYSVRTRGVAAGLKSAGRDVHVVARPGYPWDVKTDKTHPDVRRDQSELDGVPYVHIPGMNLNSAPLDHYIQAAADGYVREARRTRPELIQAASNHLTALPALMAARRVGIPFVYEVRGFWELTGASNNPAWETSERYKLAVSLETLVAREADHVLAITQQVADELVKRGVPGEKISLAPNAVDPKALVPLPKDMNYAAKRSIRTDVPIIGFAGSVVPYEGLETLLEASQQLADRGVDHQVVIAGSGSASKKLKAMRDAMKLRTVTFLGRVPNQEIPRLLSTFDIMPCPRISEKVTELVSPLKPLEAFSASKAVILSDVAPHKDIAGTNQERALLFEANDAEDLANNLQRLVQDDNLLKDLGRAGRLWTLSERNWTALGQNMVEAHRQAIDAHGVQLPTMSKPLSQVTLGVIADEFTATTLAGACEVILIDKENWRHQLVQQEFDAIFVESAWAGNSGQWHRGVGYYGPEESKDLFDLLEAAREKDIPSIFWNKEDPVHIERFIKTASQCDHVFTTDANMIPRYLQNASTHTKTVASLPFYAEPKIHNPLPSDRPYDHSVAYAGTYYGDRYKTRSRQLQRLLTTAEPHGVTIYDRQLQFENSPYQFPQEFRKYVRGALRYGEVLDQYKSHLAQLNVNSVTDSPSMYSRRVIEIAASGGIVLSGPGRGIDETLGSTILASNEYAVWSAALHAWATNPDSKLQEIWRQMRTVMRSHTTATALSIAFRTAGIPVDGLLQDTYVVKLHNASEQTLQSVLSQSVPPAAVIMDVVDRHLRSRLYEYGIEAIAENEIGGLGIGWLAEVDAPIGRTHFEDLLTTTFYGSWDEIRYQRNNYKFDTPIAQPIQADESVGTSELGLQRLKSFEDNGSDGAVLLQLVATLSPSSPTALFDGNVKTTAEETTDQVVLFAGHDLKFADQLMRHLESQGHRILVDEWQDHNKHDEAHSKALLAEADIVFCEWGLGNAVWYSHNANRNQRLIVRVHSQELRRDYLPKINHSNVESYIFVGELVRRAAVESHGVPSAKTQVIPNAVDIAKLALPKTIDAEFNIGLVGIVPRAKRLDLALDVIEHVRQHDDRYRLFIKGKQPGDYPWLMRISAEMDYYTRQYERIEKINAQSPGTVNFDQYGKDMAEWYRKIGAVLSVSDFESFHLTLADGAASGAVPYSLLWPGADLIYPGSWLYATTEQIASGVVAKATNRQETPARLFVSDNFSAASTYEALGTVIIGTETA